MDLAWFDERRTERLHLRVSPTFKVHAEQAAKETGMTLTDFALAAIRDRVEDVLGMKTVVSPEYFDDLVAELDEPPRVIPELLESIRKADARRAAAS